ncbi:MAG: hypothetical protein GQ574_05895 [Crocinitomix sp.]|nr:hypothetical protein [Crocinitomix sp.]
MLTSQDLFKRYSFERIKKEEFPIKKVVLKEIKKVLESSYDPSDFSNYHQNKFEKLIAHDFELKYHVDWKKQLIIQAEYWMRDDALILKHLKLENAKAIADFTDSLTLFFIDKKMEMHTIEGAIKRALPWHWGGVYYDDFFFDTEEIVYHLHFEEND